MTLVTMTHLVDVATRSDVTLAYLMYSLLTAIADIRTSYLRAHRASWTTVARMLWFWEADCDHGLEHLPPPRSTHVQLQQQDIDNRTPVLFVLIIWSCLQDLCALLLYSEARAAGFCSWPKLVLFSFNNTFGFSRFNCWRLHSFRERLNHGCSFYI